MKSKPTSKIPTYYSTKRIQKKQNSIHWTVALFLPVVLVVISFIFLLNDFSCSSKKKNKKDFAQNSEYSDSIRKNSVSAFIGLQLTDNDTYTPEQVLDFISMLQEEESNTIHTHTGIHSVTSRIEGYCRQMVSQSNPVFFNEALFMSCFEEMVRATFPDRLEQITIYFRNILQYRNFLESGSTESDTKNKKEQQEILWRKRQELFGIDATEELYASERFIQKIEQKLSETTSSKKSLDEKIRFLKEEIANIKSLQGNQPETASEEFIQFGELFLSSPEIQASLRSMPPEKRNHILRDIRISSGVPESRILQLEEWDRNRALLWENGKSYLSESNALKGKSELSAEEYSQELKKLRETYFTKEIAEEIEEEEKRGVSRFTSKLEFHLQ